MRDTGTATVLFTDVVASTQLRSSVGDDRADEVRRSHDTTVDSVIASHGGRLLKHTGDGVMAVFTATGAAVRAGIDVQRGVSRLRRRLEVGLQVRVGVSAGDVEWEAEDCFGLPVVEAARLCAAAAPGQILVADVVRVLAGSRGSLEFRLVGELDLAGLDGSRVVHEIPWSEGHAERLPLPASMLVDRLTGMVGRDTDLERLERAWSTAGHGRTAVAFVSGEPGIGKTRLVSELGRRVWERNGAVVVGRCDDGVRSPLRPVIEIVAHLVRHLPTASLAQLSESHRRILARLVPELDPDAAHDVGIDPLVEVPLRAAALRALFGLIGSSEPLLVVLDDLHWSDSDTLSVLRHLLVDETDIPMLFVVTYRDTDLDRTHPLAAMLADLRRAGPAERIVLRGLDPDGTGSLIEQWAGHDVPAAFVEAVVQETEGNPFFVEEVLRHLAEAGAIRVGDDGRWTSDQTPAELGIPEGVRETVGRRLARFDERTYRLLATAAVVGREFDLDIVAAVAELSYDEAITALEPAVAASLAEETATLGRFAFAHALVRATLVDELVMVRRIRTHQRIAETIEALHPDKIDDHVEDLAYHYSEAASGGTWSKAIEYQSAAAERAGRLANLAASIEHLDRALELLDVSGLDEPALKVGLLARLGFALSAGFDRSRAIEVTQRGFDLAVELGDPELLAETCNAVMNLFAFGDADVSVRERIEAAWAVISAVDDEVARATVGGMRARVLSLTPMADTVYREALADAEHAAAVADRVGATGLARYRAYLALNSLTMTRPQATRALQSAEAMLDVATSMGGARYRANALVRRIVALGQLGRRTDFDRAVIDLAESPASQAIPMYAAGVTVVEASIALLEGRLDDADRLVATVRASSEGLPNFRLGAAAQGVVLLFERGTVDLDRFERLAESSEFAWVRALVGLRRAETGDLDGASFVLESFAQQEGFGVPVDFSQAQTLRVLAETIAHVGDRTHAEALLPQLRPYSGQFLVGYMFTTCEGAADRSIGQLESVLGRHAEAIDSFDAALSLERGFHARALEARTQAWLARALRDRGTGDDITRHDVIVADVRQTASDLGLTAVAELVG